MKSGEENLWAAVVLAAYQDAIGLIDRIHQASTKGTNASAWEREFVYLREQIKSEWFEQICDWAGVHHSHIIDMINKKSVKH